MKRRYWTSWRREMNRMLSLIGVVLVVGCGSPPPDGPYEEYYDNGQVWTKTTYKDGVQDGLREEYYEDGQLRVKETYKDGVEDGPYEFYYENGELMMKGTMKDGFGDGPAELYYENGELMSKGMTKNGEECGEWIRDGETVTYPPC